MIKCEQNVFYFLVNVHSNQCVAQKT